MKVMRMWINQPAEGQPLHRLHGTNVLAHFERATTVNGSRVETWRAYMLSGDAHSTEVNRLWLSMGWNPRNKTNTTQGA